MTAVGLGCGFAELAGKHIVLLIRGDAERAMASSPRDHSGRHAHGVQSACSRMLEKTLDRPVTVEVISSSLGIATLLPGGTAFGQLGFPADALYKAPWLAWFGGAYGAVALLSQPIAAPRL